MSPRKNLLYADTEMRISVVIACLQEIDVIGRHQVHDAVFFRKTTGPCSCKHIFERLWFSNSLKWIPEDSFNYIESTQGYSPIRFNPVSKILTKFRLKDGDSVKPTLFLQGPALF